VFNGSTYERHWLVGLRIALFSLDVLLTDSKLELPELLPKFVYADICVLGFFGCHFRTQEGKASRRALNVLMSLL